MSGDNLLIRQRYMDDLADLSEDRKTIKVLTGMRGVGKTVILQQFAQNLTKIGDKNVVRLDLDSVKSYGIRTANDLKTQIVKSLEKLNDPCVFIDEVQKISGWDDVLLGFMELGIAEFFVSSSDDSVMYPKNIKLRKYLREMRVYPLSVSEFMALNDVKNEERAVSMYLKYGGMPFVRASSMSEEEAFMLLHGKLCESILLDGLTYKSRPDPGTAMDIVKHVLDTAGHPMDSDDIVSVSGKRFGYTNRTLKSMAGTYVAYEAEGRSIINILKKTRMIYYASDLGIRNCINGVSHNIREQAENAVFIELKRRGCKVKVEEYAANIAFVADYGDGKIRYFISDLEINSSQPGKKTLFAKSGNSIDTVRITLNGTSGDTFISLNEFLTGVESNNDGND